MARRRELRDAGGEVRAVVTWSSRDTASEYRADRRVGLLYLELRAPTRERMVDDNLTPELAEGLAAALLEAVAEIR